VKDGKNRTQEIMKSPSFFWILYIVDGREKKIRGVSLRGASKVRVIAIISGDQQKHGAATLT
jgi:hypothetical protein